MCIAQIIRTAYCVPFTQSPSTPGFSRPGPASAPDAEPRHPARHEDANERADPIARSPLSLRRARPRADAGRAASAAGDELPAPGFFAPPARYKSAEVLSDRRVTFRLCAPEATTAMVTSSDYAPAIPMGFGGAPPGLAMAKDTSGLWSATTSVPVEPGTYRFNFRVNGARVPDPQATRFSEERVGVNSVFEVTGTDGAFQAYDPKIPHGVVSAVEYWSTHARRQAARARLHAAGLHEGRGALPGALSRARCGRQRQQLDVGRPRELHPRQPHRRRQGEADDRRHAVRPHAGPSRRRHAVEHGLRRRSA